MRSSKFLYISLLISQKFAIIIKMIPSLTKRQCQTLFTLIDDNT